MKADWFKIRWRGRGGLYFPGRVESRVRLLDLIITVSLSSVRSDYYSKFVKF